MYLNKKMARKTKKPKVELFNEKKMETVYDFGNVKVATKWDDVTLQQMCNFMKIKADKEELLEKDRKEAERNKEEFDDTLEKYNVTDKDILKCFSDIDPEKIDLLPAELYEHLLAQLAFIVNDPLDYKPSKYLNYQGNTFLINDMESLKVKEYKDADSIMRSNNYDYPSLLAVLCRLKTGNKHDNVTGMNWDVNEDYTEEFANKIFDARRHMYAEMPVRTAMPLIAFFFIKSLQSQRLFQNFLTTQGHQLRDTVVNIENSLKSMDLSIWSKARANMTLRKLKKQIDAIL